MAEVKWIKIVTDIFDDEKILLIESAPDADAVIVIWFKLLCLAGKQNNDGVFIMNKRIPYTEEMLATIFRRPVNTVRMALGIFEQYGMIERINDVITIPNWNKHQSLDMLEKNRDYHKKYMQRRREEQKKLCEANCDVNSEVNCDVTVNGLDKNRLEEDKIREDKKTTKGILQEFAGDDRPLMDALKEFDKMRKLIKSPMTDEAKKRLLNKLQKYPREDWIPILNQSCQNNWKDIYDLKGDDNGNGRKQSVSADAEAGTGSVQGTTSKWHFHYDNDP